MTATVDSSSVQDIQKKVRGVLRSVLDCVRIIGHRRSALDTGIQGHLAFVANRKEKVSTPYHSRRTVFMLEYQTMCARILLGKWTEDDINLMLSTASRLSDIGERIQYISGSFLEIPYQESTLIGNSHTDEELVVNFSGIDCFTFLDYVEALRQSFSFGEFLERLKKIRYRSGTVSFRARNHFFTDWRESSGIKDITRQVGGERTRTCVKSLNLRSDGTLFLPGIPVTSRSVDYVPTAFVDEEVIHALCTGDYIGIYTQIDGLDVSHVGIAIRHDDGVYLRHASSAESCRKVTDRLLVNYMKEKPGIVVLRPQSFHFDIFRGTL